MKTKNQLDSTLLSSCCFLLLAHTAGTEVELLWDADAQAHQQRRQQRRDEEAAASDAIFGNNGGSGGSGDSSADALAIAPAPTPTRFAPRALGWISLEARAWSCFPCARPSRWRRIPTGQPA